MKKSKILACILSAMVLTSCLATPALAANPAKQETKQEIQNATIVKEVKKDLSSNDPNVIQKDQIITTYSDGTEIIDTLTVTESPTQTRSASKRVRAEHSKDVKRGSSGVVARFFLNAEFEYNVQAQTVIRTGYSKKYTLQPGYTLGHYDLEVDTGAGGAWWKPWTNVTGKYFFYLTAGQGLFSNGGTLELKCDSDGHIERK